MKTFLLDDMCRDPASNRISSIFVIFLLLLGRTAAWTLPFLSSQPLGSLEQEAQWLSTPSEVIRREFHSKPLDQKDQDHKKDHEDRVLILTPLKDASIHLAHHFALLSNLTYPHHLIDLGFIIGDTTDDTRSVLDAEIAAIETGKGGSLAFNSCTIVLKDLGNVRSQDVAARHGFGAQVERRKKLAIVRNTLLRKTLKPEHDWVYWRDVDVAESPPTILEDFIAHQKDVLVPSKIQFSTSQFCPSNDKYPDIWFRRQQKGSMIEGGCKQSIDLARCQD